MRKEKIITESEFRKAMEMRKAGKSFSDIVDALKAQGFTARGGAELTVTNFYQRFQTHESMQAGAKKKVTKRKAPARKASATAQFSDTSDRLAMDVLHSNLSRQNKLTVLERII